MIFLSAVTAGGLLARISHTKLILSKVKVASNWVCFQNFPDHFEDLTSGLDIKSVSYAYWGPDNFSVVLFKIGRNWFTGESRGNEVNADLNHFICVVSCCAANRFSSI